VRRNTHSYLECSVYWIRRFNALSIDDGDVTVEGFAQKFKKAIKLTW